MLNFKRILYALAALAMIAIGVGIFIAGVRWDPGASGSGGGEEKYMFLNEVDAGFQVFRNGEMTVTEQLNYDLGSKAWRGLYQDVILKNNEEVESVEVSRVEGGFPVPLAPGSGIKLGVGGAFGSYGYGIVNDGDRKLRIVWNVNDTGAKTFIVKYTLSGAVKNNRDASSLLWDAWGTGWETGVGRLNVNVSFPRRILTIHPRTDGLQDRVQTPTISGNKASFSVRDLPAGRFVQMQVAAQPLSGMRRENSDILPSLAEEQQRIDAYNADRAEKSAELDARSFGWFALWALAGALIALIVVYLIYLRWGRDRSKPIAAGGSYQYPPEKIPAPVIVKALGGAATENLVSASLLSMLQRDVFRVMPSVNKKEDIGIRNNVGESTFDTSKVEPWELPIAELLQTAIDDHDEHSPDFTKLKKHLSPTTAETKIAAFEKALDGQMPAFGLKRTYRGYVRRTFFSVLAGAIYIVALIAVLANSGADAAERWDNSWIALPMFGFGSVLLWAAIEGNAFYRLRADQEDRVRKWETYEDFFRRMDLSNQHPLTVEIWDEALIYAAAFGYADKVITKLPREGGVSDTSGLGMISSGALGASAIGSMTSGMSSVTGMASSSSSGGGGSSGGSSGGGGGGGW